MMTGKERDAFMGLIVRVCRLESNVRRTWLLIPSTVFHKKRGYHRWTENPFSVHLAMDGMVRERCSLRSQVLF